MLSTKAKVLHRKRAVIALPFLKRAIKPLKLSSTACAIAGGVLLASNTSVSKFGFILLACSSGQLLLASLAGGDRMTAFYAGSLFTFVDCLGVYRWLLL